MIKINLNHSGTTLDHGRMSWLARRLREESLLSTWPTNLNVDETIIRAKTIYQEGVKASGLTDHVVYFIINPQEGATRPPHPEGREKNFSPSNYYPGWYFQCIPNADDDDSVVSTQHMNHVIEPGPTERFKQSYAHLSDDDMAELLGCNRLLAFQSTPQHLVSKGDVPTGTDLIEEIQCRLRRHN